MWNGSTIMFARFVAAAVHMFTCMQLISLMTAALFTFTLLSCRYTWTADFTASIPDSPTCNEDYAPAGLSVQQTKVHA